MGYLTAKQFSEKWGISERRIIKLCSENRISGAMKNGMIWVIPEDTVKPSDKRSKISKYINTQKRVMIININNEIGHHLVQLLNKEGYIVEGICSEEEKINEQKLSNIEIIKTTYKDKSRLEEMLKQTNQYYDGLVLIDTDTKIENKKWIIEEFSKKMNCEASIVIVNYLKDAEKLESKLAHKLKSNIGARINSLNIDIPDVDKIIIDNIEIAEDILNLLTKFKNTTGISITTDAGYLDFSREDRTEDLEIGRFYKAINNCFKKLNKTSYIWCASTMLKNEWTEEPAEMHFRVTNLELANKGAKFERIFIFSKNKIKEFKNNKTLKIYMQSNIDTMFVDYDEVKANEPKLLEIVGNGWDGINKDTLIVDLPETSDKRGYISKNTKEILKAYECFQKLKGYSRNLREILK